MIKWKKNNEQVWYFVIQDRIIVLDCLNRYWQKDKKHHVFLGWLK
jgi:hypothetical protein